MKYFLAILLQSGMYLGGGLGRPDPLPKLKVLGRIITFQSKKNYSK